MYSTQYNSTEEMDPKKSCEQLAGPDSGFLSGVLTTEECIQDSSSNIEPEDLMTSTSSSQQQQHHHQHHQSSSSQSQSSLEDHASLYADKTEVYQRLDSGVDVDLTLSGLNLEQQQQQQSTSSNSEQQQQQNNWTHLFTPDDDGDTYVHLAILQGLAHVLSIIQLTPHPALLNLANDKSQTPLHLAVMTRQAKTARALIVAGARVDLRDCDGNTPIHLAVGDLDCLKAVTMPISMMEIDELKTCYGNMGQKLPSSAVDYVNYDGQSPIHIATLQNSLDSIHHLHYVGVNLNAQEHKSGRTPLHYSIERGFHAVTETLLNLGCNIYLQNYCGQPPVELAVRCRNTVVIEMFIRRGIHVAVDESSSSSSEDDEDDDEEYSIQQQPQPQLQHSPPNSPVICT